MNKDEVLDMPAGKEIDYLIDDKVFGMVNISTGNPFESDLIPNYSTNMSDAWKVAEKSGVGMLNNVHGIWECYVGNVVGKSKSAPLAICRAALLAVVPANVGGV